MTLGSFLIALWQISFLTATIAQITNTYCVNDDFGKWLAISGIANLSINAIFWLIVFIYYISNNRSLLIVNTALTAIWYSLNWPTFAIGIDLFQNSICAQNNQTLYDSAIILFVYFGILLIGSGLALFYGIYFGKCNHATFG